MASYNPTPKKIRKCDSSARPEPEAQGFDTGTQLLVEEMYLEEIFACQLQLGYLTKQAGGDIINAKKKFNVLRKAYLVRRRKLIKSIPNFWYIAFSKQPDLSTLLRDDEEDCFHHLTRIDVVEANDIQSGFRLEFYFSENPYFHNAVLTKEFKIGAQGKLSVSTTVEWKEGMCLLQKHNTGDDNLPHKRKPRRESFFEWFNNNSDPTGDKIAVIIKDKLWQTPVQYFKNPDVKINHNLGEEKEEVMESSLDENEHAALQEMEDPLALGPDENPPEKLQQNSMEKYFTTVVEAKDGLDEEEEEDEVEDSSAAKNGPAVPHQTDHLTAQNDTESGSTLVRFLTPNIEQNNGLEEEDDEEVDEDSESIDEAIEEDEATVESEESEAIEDEEATEDKEVMEDEEINDQGSIEDDEAVQHKESIKDNDAIENGVVVEDEEDEAVGDDESFVEDSVDEDVAEDEDIENTFGKNLTNEDGTVVPQHLEVEEEEYEVGNAVYEARLTNTQQIEDISHYETDDPFE